jgi:two-component system CheB/CheR fusion protein
MTTKSSARSFPIACVGASAGGLEALIQMLKALPGSINMAFVLVQHLEPHHKSILTEILARNTSLSIHEAKNNTKVKPGHIYVIPPNSYLSISRRTLKVTPRTKHLDGKYLPIDLFMSSLARDQGKKAVGIVLSGTGSDGTLGVKAIKANGGITFAQDKKTAKYFDMPSSAITSGMIDHILSPEAIAGSLAGARANKQEVALKPLSMRLNKEDAFNKILILLHNLSGVEFIHYKRATVERRILRRMGFHKITSFQEYYNYLKHNPKDAETLHKDILIPVTMFFRDPKIFTSIKKVVLPRIIKNRELKDPIRVWVPACSTGEEVYSLAMTIYEFLEENMIKPDFQIFGTDLGNAHIEKARSATYPEDITAHVSPVRLRRFFTKTDSGYKIAKHIRDMCIFAKQDITNDPPLSNMDIVTCRNLLIYLDTFLQAKVLSVIHYALKPKGFLILGSAESITSVSDLPSSIKNVRSIQRISPGAGPR